MNLVIKTEIKQKGNKRQKDLKEYLDCEFIRINPDEKDFSAYDEPGKIQTFIDKSKEKNNKRIQKRNKRIQRRNKRVQRRNKRTQKRHKITKKRNEIIQRRNKRIQRRNKRTKRQK